MPRVMSMVGDQTRLLMVLANNDAPGVSLSEAAQMTFYGRVGVRFCQLKQTCESYPRCKGGGLSDANGPRLVRIINVRLSSAFLNQ